MWRFSTRPARCQSTVRRPAISPRLEALEDRCTPSAGALDPTFGSGAGFVTTDMSSVSYGARQVLVQPSGTVIAAGDSSVPVTTTTTTHGKTTTTTTNVEAFGVAAYNPDGSPDTAFGSGGISRQLFAGNAGSGLDAAALEPMGSGDSKILLAGGDFAQAGMALMRLNANGTRDTTFGTNGQVVTYFPQSGSTTYAEVPHAVAVTGGGQILAVGNLNASTSVLLARYNPNGTLDTTFGANGTATTVISSPATGFSIAVTGTALQPDGKFVVAGDEFWRTTVGTTTVTMSQGMLLRYNANGSLDTTFGSGGIVTTQIPFGSISRTTFTGLALYPNAGTANDGKIVTAGWVGQCNGSGQVTAVDWVAARYNANGSLDPTFGSGAGYTRIHNSQLTGTNQYAYAVALAPGGKPILAGSVNAPAVDPYDGYSQLARLNLDGSLDAGFGTDGLVATPIGNWNNSADGAFRAVAVQPDGKIVAAGEAFNSSNKLLFTVARYLPSAPQVGSFTASPSPVAAGGSVALTAGGLTDGNAGATVTQVAFYYYDSSGTEQVPGYGTRNADGTWTLTFSTAGWAAGTYTLFAQATDSLGAVGDPVSATLQLL